MRKNFSKSMAGVTLLEIMLVMAIAAMIIVMSVRYYQSANASQQANTVLAQIQSITAAADSLSQASGSYSKNATTSKVQSLLPANGLRVPWGAGQIKLSSGSDGTQYNVSIPDAPQAVCNIIVAQLAQNKHFNVTSPAVPLGGAVPNCAQGTTTITYTYQSNVY